MRVGVRGVIAAFALAAGLVATSPASAQVPGDGVAQRAPTPQVGDEVILLLNDGSYVRGVLVDRTRHGYLVRQEEGSVLVEYERVADLQLAGRSEAHRPKAGDAPPPAVAPEPRESASGEDEESETPPRWFVLHHASEEDSSEYELRAGGPAFEAIPVDAWFGGGQFRLYDDGGRAWTYDNFWKVVGLGRAYKRNIRQQKAGAGLFATSLISGVLLSLTGASLVGNYGAVFAPVLAAGIVLGAFVAPISIGVTISTAKREWGAERIYREAHGYARRQGATASLTISVPLGTSHHRREMR